MTALIIIGVILAAIVSLVAGFYVAKFIDILENKKRLRREKRFAWYYKMGLHESACLIEPTVARKVWIGS